MVFIAGGEANADETQADDAVAGDAASAVTIGTQPANASVAATNTQAFTVAATKTGAGTLTYQWQVSTDGGASFADVTTGTNGTTATYTTAATAAGDSGNQYRVKVGTTAGAVEVTSTAATLTVTE